MYALLVVFCSNIFLYCIVKKTETEMLLDKCCLHFAKWSKRCLRCLDRCISPMQPLLFSMREGLNPILYLNV